MPDAVQEQAWLWLWRGAVASAWVLSAMALWQYFQDLGQGIGWAGLRPNGPLLDTNSFATWLNLLFFLCSPYILYAMPNAICVCWDAG